MARRRHHYRQRNKQPMELDVTTFLNLMVVLVPFLLITAVFSRITIVELTLPSSTGGSAPETTPFRVEVIVREQGLEISNGSAVIAGIPKQEDDYDFETLTEYLLSLKRDHPDLESASVLVEKQIPYDYLIQAMDATRSAELTPEDELEEPLRVALFPNISVGDAP